MRLTPWGESDTFRGMSQEQNRPPPSPEERILEATIKCIEMHGIQGVTTRRIAAIAGVNSAAINYYYRSKEKLVAKALSTSVESTFGDWERIIADDALPLEERLRFILREAVEGARVYPNMAKAHVHGPVMEGDYETEFARRFRGFSLQLRDCVAPLLQGLTLDEVELRVTALFCGAIMVGLMPGMFGDLRHGGLAKAGARLEYVELLIRQFIQTAGGAPGKARSRPRRST